MLTNQKLFLQKKICASARKTPRYLNPTKIFFCRTVIKDTKSPLTTMVRELLSVYQIKRGGGAKVLACRKLRAKQQKALELHSHRMLHYQENYLVLPKE